jgi:hypothetical protein
MSTQAELKTWLTFDECADRCARAYWLEKLADQVAFGWPDTVTEEEVCRRLARCAHHSLTSEECNELFDEHVTALRRLNDLELGIIGWADVNENLTVPDRTAAAREILDAQAADAFDVLLNGKKWGTS